MAGMRKTTRELFATGLRYLDAPRTLLEEQFESFVLRHRLVQERRLQLLAVIATAGPLLGLLGTVTGMIATFDVITEHGTGNPKLMSAGIAEALICTAFGLGVAIPTLIAGNVLATIGESIKNTLERGSLALLNALESHRDQPTRVTADERQEKSA